MTIKVLRVKRALRSQPGVISLLVEHNTRNSDVGEVLLRDVHHLRKPGDRDADVGDHGSAAGPQTQARVVQLVTGVPELVAVFSLKEVKSLMRGFRGWLRSYEA